MPTDSALPAAVPAAPHDIPASRPAPERGRRAAGLFVALLLTLLTLGLVAAVAGVWRPLQARLAAQAMAQAQLADRVDALSAWQANASEDLAALEGRSRGLTARLDQLGPARLSAWALAEADYLLRSAQRALRLDYDPARAALALDLASASLAPVPNSGALRDAIEQARLGLRTAQIPDTAALADDLADTATVLQSAPLREPGSPPSGTATPGWRGVLHQAWQQLGDVIVIQRVGSPVQPLLRPQEAQYLRQQFSLKLAAAEYALRRRDSAAAQTDIGDLQAWVEAYLDTGAPAVADALATLRRLASIDLRPALPDLSGLEEQLAALRRATAADHAP